MATKKLETQIVLNGKDGTGAAFASAARGARGLLSTMQHVGSQMRTVGLGMTAAITLPIAMFAKSSLDAFESQENALTSFRQVLKTIGPAAGFNAKQLTDMAAGLQRVSTFKDEDILDGVTKNLLLFRKIQGPIFKSAQKDIIDYATMAKIGLSEATTVIGKALGGSQRGLMTLQKIGVIYTKDQEKALKAMLTSGNAAMRVRGQMILLAAIERRTHGQALAASKTTQGQMIQLANSFREIKISIGAIIAQIVPLLVGPIQKAVEWFSKLSEGTKRNLVMIAGGAALLGPLLIVTGTAISGFVKLAEVIGFAGGALKSMAAIDFGLTALRWAKGADALEVAYAALDWRVAHLVPGIGALRAAGPVLGTLALRMRVLAVSIPTVSEAFAGLFASVKNIGALWPILVEGAAAAAAGLIPLITAFGALTLAALPWIALAAAVAGAAYLIYKYWGPISDFIGGLCSAIGSTIKTWLAGPMEWVTDFIVGAWDIIKQAFAAAWGAIKPYVDFIGNGASHMLTSAWGSVVGFFKGMWNAVVGIFTWAWNKIKPIIDGVVNGAKWIWDKIGGWKGIAIATGPVGMAAYGAAQGLNAIAQHGAQIRAQQAKMLAAQRAHAIAAARGFPRRAVGGTEPGFRYGGQLPSPASSARSGASGARHAPPPHQKVEIGKGELNIKITTDTGSRVTGVKSTAPKNMNVRTGVDNTGSGGH